MTGNGARGGPPRSGAADSRRGRRSPRGSRLGLLALLATACGAAGLGPGVPDLAAQQVQFTPRPDRPAERRLDRFVERGGYALWDRDTTVARGDTVPGDVLVLESVVRVEGRVEGALYAVDADLFLRPGGEVGGDLVVLGGGMHRADRSQVDGEVLYAPNVFLQAVPRAGGYAIYRVEERPKAFTTDGLSGIRLPRAQRVDGWVLSAGAGVRALEAPWQPGLHVTAGIRTEGARLSGSVRQEWYPSGRWTFGVEAARETRTEDRWIRADIPNTVTHLVGGRDFRNYYEADRVDFLLRRQLGGRGAIALRAGWEEDHSLPARYGGELTGGSRLRRNPPVADGEMWRGRLEARLEPGSGPRRFGGLVRLEGAEEEIGGDFSFLRAEARVRWRQPVVGRTRLELFGIGRGDLAGTLPPQRWSAIGGPGTLPTLDVLELRGERLLFTRWTYAVPLPVLQVPKLGPPNVLLRAAAGAAWSPGETPDYRENLVLGLRFLFLEGGVALDPEAEDGDPTGFVTVRIPR